ncbi:hypothetical protein JCM19037_2531 [Geomicrobium sp. JCM 19037]|uniref:hypothetical protein n=1 Tax=Geomicrobium sp. JCM 19037 TaxID=1460634 RepID=UPI00045F1BB1|nr:hypothetical protein [Geomicrobium sp. JCM 19037]GAK04149.1 hypothetical protein JCM19037_2531 [Geomicrobium sp. JCM 19037]
MTQKWWMIVAGLGMFMITIFGFLFASNDRQPDTLEASLDELLGKRRVKKQSHRKRR